MNRMENYVKKYESGQVLQGQNEGLQLEQTNEKKNKYYSYNDHDETIRKKLVLEYPEHHLRENIPLAFAVDKQPASSTKYTISQKENHNKKMIDKLESSLKSYQPHFSNKVDTKKINFSEVDLELEHKKYNLNEQFIASPQVQVEAISAKLKNKKVIEESEKLLQEFLPRHRVNKVDREIAALYKQNRNVNLEYRRDKFMQIFTGQSHLSKKDADILYKY